MPQMADDTWAGSPLMHATRLLAPSAVVRIAARLRQGMLDRTITDGADPSASPLIAARTMQLAGNSTRARIAGALERLAESANKPRGRARILPSRAAAIANEQELLGLAAMLRDDRPLNARGVAMLNMIVTDGAGPAYTDQRGDALALELKIARSSLTS